MSIIITVVISIRSKWSTCVALRVWYVVNGESHELQFLHLSVLHLIVLKKQDIHYSITYDSRTGHTRHVSALTVAHAYVRVQR